MLKEISDKSAFAMAVILVTGALGQLGSEIRKLSDNFHGYDFIFTDKDDLDITSEDSVNKFITFNKPGWVINCAAYNLVDKAESESDIAFLVNGTSVKNLTDAIKGTGCKLIHLSTDYVFDGMANSPYNENCETNPQSVYGRSKLAGEKYALQHYSTMVIRTSWLYSSFCHNFVKTIIKHAKEKELLKVVFDQTGTPTYAADLAGAILHIVSGVIRNQMAFIPGIYHYSNEGVCSWYDFATEILHEVGIDTAILPILSADYPTPAKRPAYSVMDKSKIKETYRINIPYWRDSLVRCLKILNQKQI